MAGHRKTVGGAAALEAGLDRDVMAEPGFVCDGRQCRQQAAKVDRCHVLALQFGIEPAGVGNIRDQPVEPFDVVLDNSEQSRAAVLVASQWKRFDGGAQRRQRVLQFMGNVGGEHLDRLDAAVERIGHVAQRPGEMANLVAASAEIGDLDAGLDAATDAFGAIGKPSHRAGDRARQQQRQHDHDRGRHAADFQNGETLGGHHLVDVVALRGEHQRAAHRTEALYRHCDRDDHLAALIDAHHAALLSVQRARDLLVAVAAFRA
jgi:hypothetical protein